MNQAIDFVDNSLKRPHDNYKAKCEALLALDREVKELTKVLVEKIEALDELEEQISIGA